MSTIETELAIGIDVSHHKGVIDWKKVADAKIVFGFAKATEGDSYTDPAFDFNWVGMRKNRIIRGAYHFFRPAIDPIDQAKNYLRMVGDTLHHSDLPPVLDVEGYPTYVREEFLSLSISERHERVQAWLAFVEDAVGRVPMIYTNFASWNEMMGNTENFTRHPLWVAHYKVATPLIPANNWGNKGWTFWQNTEKGSVPGIGGGEPGVDLDVYRDVPQDLKNRITFTGERKFAPEITNGELMAAIINTADNTGNDAGAIIEKLELEYLVNPVSNSTRPFDGSSIGEFKLSSSILEELLGEVAVIPENRIDMWGITNQNVVNAFYKAGDNLSIPGWDLLIFADLTHLVDARSDQYTGPLVGDLPGLTSVQKEEIARILGVELFGTDIIPDPDVVEEPEVIEEVSLTYPGVTNQIMINLFYQIAEPLGLNGWDLIEEARLTYLADDRGALYSGPKFEEMTSLNAVYHIALAEALGVSLAVLEDPDIILINDIPPESSSEPYANLRNQDMINIFYQAGGALGLSGWFLVELAKLESIGEEREANYAGPRIEDLDSLSAVYQQVLLTKLEYFYNIEDDIEEEIAEGIPYLDVNNQDVINAFYQSAAQFQMSGWDLVEIAELTDLAEDRYVLYSGPRMEDVENLSSAQRLSLTNSLIQIMSAKDNEGAAAHNISDQLFSIQKGNQCKAKVPYPGLVNQDMVNLFYSVATNAGQSGREWLTFAGLDAIGETRKGRYQSYNGPEVDQLTGLSDEQRLLLSNSINQWKNSRLKRVASV